MQELLVTYVYLIYDVSTPICNLVPSNCDLFRAQFQHCRLYLWSTAREM